MTLTHFLTTMNIRNLFAALVVLATIFACAPADVDEVFYEYEAYINQSSHTITLSLYDSQNHTTADIVIKPGETSQNLLTSRYRRQVCTVKFGEIVLLDYLKLSKELQGCEYDISYRGKHYQNTTIDKYSHVYTYTFTDADYQFALENGTELEN